MIDLLIAVCVTAFILFIFEVVIDYVLYRISCFYIRRFNFYSWFKLTWDLKAIVFLNKLYHKLKNIVIISTGFTTKTLPKKAAEILRKTAKRLISDKPTTLKK